ncbi:MAG: tRNA 5-methoxyuridine(34)/uridine 5-oxyacetic acid(34) synthase CmoB [Desulfobacteraceae bacterium 4572_35.1]|nr:MAG: tRNA 5-methoxyuridine(34)/uridine 5-oxyacetic acid(34) synthase CmoB [Desulfobacteraceae bacterium 4572_35.1]
MNSSYRQILQALDPSLKLPWLAQLKILLQDKEYFQRVRDRKSQKYLSIIDNLPPIIPKSCQLDQDWITVGAADELDTAVAEQLLHALYGLRPWRKGPFNIFGTTVDCEWVSYLKWNRLSPEIAPLRGRKILDIGSSCGYYLYRMSVQQPQLLIGLEPYATFYFQFRLLQHLIKAENCYTIPAKFEELPLMEGYFDTIFHMGVLYHVRSPLDTLIQMRRTLRRGGELVLETLVIPGEEYLALSPPDRYAKMNNVYFLPTVTCLSSWLEKAGFTNIRCIDVARTTSAEQRKTAWIQTESLSDFLAPDDKFHTIEGHPAPRRALMIAEVK